MMSALLLLLDGKKTYLAATGFVVIAGVQAFVFHDYTAAGQSLMSALTAAGLRAAVAKNGLSR
jgi:hypothetical protein